ncbi:hypothetical protein DPEC_G00247200 [Dallia pectoralis]|uniref:Uncharacterized protein n=1 Tax=Dallia pectoralis TaxID=75939 RepID=A0ACC2FWG3_DALPE|nr:hypothetical protein DPEC_G00247200 [Dallia pectoralis]
MRARSRADRHNGQSKSTWRDAGQSRLLANKSFGRYKANRGEDAETATLGTVGKESTISLRRSIDWLPVNSPSVGSLPHRYRRQRVRPGKDCSPPFLPQRVGTFARVRRLPEFHPSIPLHIQPLT